MSGDWRGVEDISGGGSISEDTEGCRDESAGSGSGKIASSVEDVSIVIDFVGKGVFRKV